jgi:hypothetical protein
VWRLHVAEARNGVATVPVRQAIRADGEVWRRQEKGRDVNCQFTYHDPDT